jgi:hypothetical protein
MDETDFNTLRGGYRRVYVRGNSRISLLEAATNDLWIFNMYVSMARQGGWVQLEHSDMRQALNTAKMAKERFSPTAIEETKYHIKKPRGKVREEKKWVVQSPGPKNVKVVIQRNPAMLHQNQTSGGLPCHNGTAQNPVTPWRRDETGAPPPD